MQSGDAIPDQGFRNIKSWPSGGPAERFCVRKIMMRCVKTWILLATTERAMIPTGKDPIANMVYRPRLDSSFRKSNLL